MPVVIVNVAGGGASFYENSIQETYVEKLARRSYSWEALENVSSGKDKHTGVQVDRSTGRQTGR